ncbi:MAG TPA: hypothetical protein PLO61_10045 [Fimbriimonadaceae bacterium]|nr:hypothetical protein [Fimbriimonadaceae bacterium]HRJ33954.1 hypothetical protein [Fimbriimonadaceae bacterium]
MKKVLSFVVLSLMALTVLAGCSGGGGAGGGGGSLESNPTETK